MFFRPWKIIIRISMDTTKALTTIGEAVQAPVAALSHSDICQEVH